MASSAVYSKAVVLFSLINFSYCCSHCLCGLCVWFLFCYAVLSALYSFACQNVCGALTFLLDNIFIRFGTKLYRQVIGIPMGTYCAPLVADLFLFCYEKGFYDFSF